MLGMVTKYDKKASSWEDNGFHIKKYDKGPTKAGFRFECEQP